MPTNPVEEILRGHLELRASEVAPPPPPVAAVLRGVQRRRQRAALVAALAAVTVVMLTIGLSVRPGLGHRAVVPATPAQWTVRTVPTAGDLAGDAAWLRSATARAEALTGQRVEHVVFAGRLDEGGVTGLLVATADTPELVALYGLDGSAAGLQRVELKWTERRVGGQRYEHDVSVAFAGPAGLRYYVVVPLSEVRTVAVSPGRNISPGGQVSRAWAPVRLRANGAWGPLGPATLLQPRVQLDGGPQVEFAYSQTLTPSAELPLHARALVRTWNAGPAPASELIASALGWVGQAVDLSMVATQPVYSGPLQPAGNELAVIRIRPQGSAPLYLIAAGHGDSTRVELAGQVLLPPDAHPPVWLRDGRAGHPDTLYLFEPGVDRVVVQDLRERPCTGRAVLGTGRPDARGLVTIAVTIPAGCRDPRDGSFRRIVAIRYDAAGRELGREPIQQDNELELP